MRFKKLRFALGLSILFSILIFTGQYVPTEESCFNCAMEEMGFLDIYNDFNIPMVVLLKSGESLEDQILVPPLTYKSVFFFKGKYVWKAWWVNAFNLPQEWDWGYVYVKPGSRAVIKLAPKK